MKVLQIVTIIASLMISSSFSAIVQQQQQQQPFHYSTYSNPYQSSYSVATPTFRQSFTTKLHNNLQGGFQPLPQPQNQLIPQTYNFVPSQFGVPQNINPYATGNQPAYNTPQAVNPAFNYNNVYRTNNGFNGAGNNNYNFNNRQPQYPSVQGAGRGFGFSQQPGIQQVYTPQQATASSGYNPSVIVDLSRSASGSGRSINGLSQAYRLAPEEVSAGAASYDAFKPLFIASAPDKLQDAVDANRARNLLGVAYSPANKVSHIKFERGNLKYNF